ncbi:MAG: hypothetical protein HYS07_02165 [Chlamydiae bacterium]|nr:hypothetical protein [Chlamydiota bacterium]
MISSLAQSKEKTALYKILEIQEGTKEEKQFLAQWAAVIKARVQELCGQGLELETETLPDGAYIFYFGDEENDKEGYDFSTPYGNHVGDMKFFVSLKHLMNIPKAHRQADFMFGTSHEAIHEISGRGDEIHKYLTPQDARILRTGKIGNVQVIENADIFSQVFLKTRMSYIHML